LGWLRGVLEPGGYRVGLLGEEDALKIRTRCGCSL
jgi:hypothetical protein